MVLTVARRNAGFPVRDAAKCTFRAMKSPLECSLKKFLVCCFRLFSEFSENKGACHCATMDHYTTKKMKTNKATATATTTATDTQETATAKARPANVIALGQYRQSIDRLVGDCQSANCAIGRVASALGKDSSAKRALSADLGSVSAPDLAAVRRLTDAGAITRKDAGIYFAAVKMAQSFIALQSALAYSAK